MFGVMTDAERETLQNGLISAAKGSDENISVVRPKLKSGLNEEKQADGNEVPEIGFSKLDNRQLYFYLLNAELFPDVSKTAKLRVEKILRQSRLLNRLPFKQYRHERFENYVQSLYQQEINAYHPLTAEPRLSKQAYAWGIEQFAPTILTDGSWLQTSCQLKNHTHHAIGDLLCKIYVDEMGNGLLRQNHPYIYRQLLNSLHIKLPAIHTQQFCNHPSFIDSAFDLPVYLMAISRFPAAFLAELLGLNLAIELSGLGKVYLRLAEELEYWGIDAHIVKLHITIDNFASGHSAMAMQAIQLYLDEILAGHGELAVQRHWQRIYAGYCSLQTASLRFKYALIYHYGLNLLKGHFRKQQQGM